MFDWKIAIFALQFISTMVTIFIFCVIKFNDLKHLGINMDKLTKNMKKVFSRLNKIEKAITRRDAVCAERHKK